MNTIAQVKPERAAAVENMLISMSQRGQVITISFIHSPHPQYPPPPPDGGELEFCHLSPTPLLGDIPVHLNTDNV